VKKILLILSIVFPLFAYNIAAVNAQQTVSPATTPTVFFCVGDNPQPPCATVAPTEGTTSAPTTGVSVNPVSGQPSPSTSPEPTTNPCSTSQQSVSEKSVGSVQILSNGGKQRKPEKQGMLQQFLQFFLQLFQLIFQQLGNQQPGSGGTVTPTPSTTGTPSTSNAPSSTPSTTVSVSPCPSASPSTSVSPSTGVSPTTATSPTTEPSTAASPTTAVSPTTEPSTAASPTTSPSSTPSTAVSPTSGTPSVTPAPTSGSLPAWLQQLLQFILQLLQLIEQYLGINPCNGTSCPTPTGSPTPSSSPSTGVSPTSATSPTSGASQSPSSTPSSSPSQAPTPTIFNVSPSPSPTVAVSPTTAMTPSVAPTITPTPGKIGLLISEIAAGTSTTNKLCLDDKGNGSANDTVVQTYACNSADKAQQWAPYSDSTIRINGKCLDVNKNGTANDTIVDLFTCNGGANQEWTLTKITSGTNNGKTELLGKQSNKCLDIKQSSTANGTQLEIFQCNNGNNQVWSWNTGTTTTPPTATSWAYLAPATLTITHTTNQIIATWSKVTGSKPTIAGGVPAPTSYTIALYRSGTLIRENTPNALTFTDSGLTKGGTITVDVWANGGPLAPPNISKTVVLTQ
jgi:ricin-type beta-trefoil lectin protein